MKTVKQLLVFSLCAVLLLAAGCGSTPESSEADKSAANSTAQNETTQGNTAQDKATQANAAQDETTQSKTARDETTTAAQGKFNPYFTAKVLEVNEKSLLVEPLEGEEELKSADRFTVSTSVISTAGVPQLEVGSIVRIIYNGNIAETYPAQIDTVFAIYLCDANGNLVEQGQ